MEKKNYATEEQKADNIQGTGVLPCVSNCCDWKVEYYKSDIDKLRDIKTVDEFDNFESAKDFTIMKIGNKMGAVRLIHPDID